MDLFLQFLGNTGFGLVDWRNLVMIVVGVFFVYLAIAKKYEPLLLLPIGFGIILGNIPFFKGFGIGIYEANSVLHYLYFGVTSGLYPSIVFLGLGAMTDFSFLLANPKLMPPRWASSAPISVPWPWVSARTRPRPWPSSAAPTGPPRSSSPPSWRRTSSARWPSPPTLTWRSSRSSSRRSCAF
jgi:hypothetical protein